MCAMFPETALSNGGHSVDERLLVLGPFRSDFQRCSLLVAHLNDSHWLQRSGSQSLKLGRPRLEGGWEPSAVEPRCEVSTVVLCPASTFPAC